MKFSKMYVFINFDKNTAKCIFWSSTGSYAIFTRGSSFDETLRKQELNVLRQV